MMMSSPVQKVSANWSLINVIAGANPSTMVITSVSLEHPPAT